MYGKCCPLCVTPFRTRHRLSTQKFETLRKMPSGSISRHGAKIFRRKVSSKLSYRYRWLRLSSHDQVELRTLRKLFVYGIVLHRSGVDDTRLVDMLVLLAMKYMSITFIFEPILRLGTLPLRTTIADFNDSDSSSFFDS